jgi:acetylornithine deacetylase/succinyl-diaminopimelate desuccinylase-like protein
MNWVALGDETVDALRRYLSIDTTNPPGNETEGARFLAALLADDGVPSEIAEAAPGRGNLVARLPGDGSLGAIVLHHHIDVVYADRRYWSVDPFEGAIRDGYLYGRGALDMKSTGILQLMAFLALKRGGTPLKRDLILLATADEEAGSAFGAQWVVEHRCHWLAGAEYALSEFGGIQQRSDWRAPLGAINVSEKTGLPLRLIARSEPGHGSMPWADTAPHRLIRALSRLLAAERPLRVLPETQAFFAGLAQVAPGADAGRFGDLAAALEDRDYRGRFLANKHYAAMVRTTFAVNMLKGSEKRNVIPPEAVADIDCRMLAGDEPDEIVAWVRRAIDDAQVDVEVMRPPKRPNLSPPDTELYKVLARALVARRPDAVVAPQILTGFTDNWTFRECGLHAYGFTPLHVGADGLGGVHGNDERVGLDDLRQGVRHYTEMLLDIAAA